jgi:Tfp pilus assembly protein PilE
MIRLFNKHGYGIVETLIVIIVLSVFVVVVMDRYETIVWEAKKTALKSELVNLRQAITLFKITKGRYPQNLKELITADFVWPYSDPKEDVFRQRYLEHYAVDKDMNILDPFDMPYMYNSSTGEVRSRKEGFEGW